MLNLEFIGDNLGQLLNTMIINLPRDLTTMGAILVACGLFGMILIFCALIVTFRYAAPKSSDPNMDAFKSEK